MFLHWASLFRDLLSTFRNNIVSIQRYSMFSTIQFNCVAQDHGKWTCQQKMQMLLCLNICLHQSHVRKLIDVNDIWQIHILYMYSISNNYLISLNVLFKYDCQMAKQPKNILLVCQHILTRNIERIVSTIKTRIHTWISEGSLFLHSLWKDML